ncbi:hypothetical protein BO83DRAFT_413008 [Aspergillus eucalypticola CBS 122712]|uniref:Uncharacterized protein n=1 Tax=Aspergillus eucalypticola (strain CBS 122712 / IBT 29274) TaxID=1448314 RepID=A0A317UJL5_ASPEC|nr:uncharacterized protein BO83DRAFT_413008 [Aspergillus eucalypticola CBS 122712]PWY61585.1 hypothetical protein BO83DRAFT_413008 [Aspergillus eucalypticola CBS 122712]
MSLGQLVSSNAHTKWAGRPTTRTPQSAAIHGHPGRLAASPSARAPYPHPGPSLPAAPRITPSHPANWSIPFASTHATRRGHRTPACLALAGPDGLLALTPFEPSQRDLIPDPSLPSSAKSNGQLAYEVGRREGGRDPGSWPGVPSQSPLQPPALPDLSCCEC